MVDVWLLLITGARLLLNGALIRTPQTRHELRRSPVSPRGLQLNVSPVKLQHPAKGELRTQTPKLTESKVQKPCFN